LFSLEHYDVLKLSEFVLIASFAEGLFTFLNGEPSVA